MERHQYSRPPVAEAMCQVTLREPAEWSPASPGLLYSAIRADYPGQPEARRPIEAAFSVSPETNQTNFSLASAPELFAFRDEEQRRVIVASATSLSANSLPPYEGWESLAARFDVAYQAFLDVVSHVVPGTVSVRYLNRIIVPGEPSALSDFVTLPVPAAQPRGSSVAGLMTRVDSVLEQHLTRTSVTLATLAHDVASESAFLLDIELVREVDPDTTKDQLISMAHDLHRLENAIFEQAITEQAREVFG